MTKPIDLRNEFSHRWRIGLDEAAGGRWKDPWYYRIVCRRGHICPWGGDVLAASTHGAGAIANRLKALAGVEVVHDGDDGATVVFPKSLLKSVAAVMKPRTVRRATPAQAAALARGRTHRAHPA
jgi:hypothetical protein